MLCPLTQHESTSAKIFATPSTHPSQCIGATRSSNRPQAERHTVLAMWETISVVDATGSIFFPSVDRLRSVVFSESFRL